MIMYTSDLKPDLEITLSDTDDDQNPLPVNIDDALSVRIIGKLDDAIIFDREPSSPPEDVGDDAVVRMEFESGDTAAEGHLDIDVEVMWPGNKRQTWRTGGIDIYPDFGPNT